MKTLSWTRLLRVVPACLLLVGLGAASASCGGGAGGAGPGGPGQGLILAAFQQSAVDNLPLNRVLEFDFSEPVNPSTCSSATIQVRAGGSFGMQAPGVIRVDGSKVYFEPNLPNLCDRSDAGLQAGTQYRVTLVGYPEEYCVRNTNGQPLRATITLNFTTLPDSSPELFDDQVPGEGPHVVGMSPSDGDAAVTVAAGNAVVLDVSENLDPCTVNDTNVVFRMVERGDPNEFVSGAPSGNPSGFVPYDDQQPADPDTWGGNGTAVTPAQVIPARIVLQQSVAATHIRIEPEFGKFPEDALFVVQVLAGIQDLGGSPLTPFTASFTTENLPAQDDAYVVENEGETPYILSQTSADVNTSRAMSKAQGFLLISGDGDNGSQMTTPTAPNVPPACSVPRDVNDGILDDFAPTSNITLDTGATINTCPNQVDGSTAVVWEFNSFHIASGITVTLAGVNGAIFLVRGEVAIDSGGTLDLSGPNGTNGHGTTASSGTWPTGVKGGKGRAGGGDGGDSQGPLESKGGSSGSYPLSVPYSPDYNSYGGDGWGGLGSPDYPTGAEGGQGAGQGNAATWHGALPPPTGPYSASSCGAGGGGGGHASAGGTGGANTAPNGNGPLSAPARGGGGAAYDDQDAPMFAPSAGSGGGAAGYEAFPSYTSVSAYAGTQATGGGGGAGGGFVDITSTFDINIHGTIDASGGRGGNGANSYFCDIGSSGGGGGGSGGGVRLLTSANIDISGATITAAGGQGGTGGSGPTCPQATAGARNDGGDGAPGRIALEDGDGVISGQNGATLVPAEGEPGFWRSKFNTSRFVGGGRSTVAVSDLFLVGAFDPTFVDPVQPYGSGMEDFLAGIPTVAAGNPGDPQILVEAQGYQMTADGQPDLIGATGWRTVGYFANSAGPDQPTWVLGQIPPSLRPSDNTQSFGITNLNGCEYIQIRLTFVMGPNASITDAGPFIDRWTIHFSHDH